MSVSRCSSESSKRPIDRLPQVVSELDRGRVRRTRRAQIASGVSR